MLMYSHRWSPSPDTLSITLFSAEDDRVASCYRLEGAIAMKEGKFEKSVSKNQEAMKIIMKQ